MLQRICLVISVCAIAFFFGRAVSQAGWDGLGLTNAHDASSLVISVKKKKHKHHDDDDNADNNDNGPETPKVDQASCAKEGLQYIAGGGDKCYCPNGFVNKATGLLVATHRSDCVTAKSYNQLDSTGAQTTPATPTAKQVCCSADIFGPDHKKKGGTSDCSDSEEKAKTRIRDHFAASQGGTDILGHITCGEPH